MRKVFSLLFICLFILSGCSSASSESIDTVTSYMSCLNKGSVKSSEKYLVDDLKSTEPTVEEIASSSGQSKEVQKLYISYMHKVVAAQWKSYKVVDSKGDTVTAEVTGIDAQDLKKIDTKEETDALKASLENGEDETDAFKTFYKRSLKKVNQLPTKKRTLVFTVKNKKITKIDIE